MHPKVVVLAVLLLAALAIVGARSFRVSPAETARPAAVESQAGARPVFAAIPAASNSPKPQIPVATALKYAGSRPSIGDEPVLTERQRALFEKHGRSIKNFYRVEIKEDSR